jgi:hypothetical protein
MAVGFQLLLTARPGCELTDGHGTGILCFRGRFEVRFAPLGLYEHVVCLV